MTDTTYITNPYNITKEGLTLLQVNPDCAADLRPELPTFGWLYTRHADGHWVTLRKLSPSEIEALVGRLNELGAMSALPIVSEDDRWYPWPLV